MNSTKEKYLNVCQQSFVEGVRKGFPLKMMCVVDEGATSYFNKQLLTPAEFLNSIPKRQRYASMKVSPDESKTGAYSVNFKFIDMEEFDAYGPDRAKGALFKALMDNSPTDDILEKLETVMLLDHHVQA